MDIDEETADEYREKLHEQPKYIVQEMMGETYTTYFDEDHPDPEALAEVAEAKRDELREQSDERNHKAYWDARAGAI